MFDLLLYLFISQSSRGDFKEAAATTAAGGAQEGARDAKRAAGRGANETTKAGADEEAAARPATAAGSAATARAAQAAGDDAGAAAEKGGRGESSGQGGQNGTLAAAVGRHEELCESGRDPETAEGGDAEGDGRHPGAAHQAAEGVCARGGAHEDLGGRQTRSEHAQPPADSGGTGR